MQVFAYQSSIVHYAYIQLPAAIVGWRGQWIGTRGRGHTAAIAGAGIHDERHWWPGGRRDQWRHQCAHNQLPRQNYRKVFQGAGEQEIERGESE